MDGKQPGLKIVYSRDALSDLNEIWNWNAKTYGSAHAHEYVEFLRNGISRVHDDSAVIRPVEGYPYLSTVLLKRDMAGDGHVAIIEIRGTTVDVLHIYHTKMDITGRLAK